MQDASGLRLRIGTFSASAETRGATIASSPGAALEPWGGPENVLHDRAPARTGEHRPKTGCVRGVPLRNLNHMSFTCRAPQFFIRLRRSPAPGR